MMTTKPRQIKDFWNEFQEFSGAKLEDKPVPEAWGFGDSPEMADELGQLVVSGTKRATCSLVIEYEIEGEAIPKPGQLSIVLDGRGEPLCIIETTEVQIKQFHQVDAAFAFEEGEGDRSLEFWRQAHRRFFTRQCEQMNLVFRDEMPVVCERFRLIFPRMMSPADPG